MTVLPLAYATDQREAFLKRLSLFIAQPSISAQGVGLEDCAQLLQAMMTEFGLTARVMPTRGGAPVVYGELHVADDAPTLLIYGHYDVQPPEPLEAWHSPPFQPTVRDGRIYGRGAADNKGQLLAHLLALEALQRLGRLPHLNIKFIVEGEEEVSSRSLPGFAAEHRDLLQADWVYIADGPMNAHGPVVSFGCRGLLYIELVAKGAARDAHSGHWGGLLPNPAWELVQLLGTMQASDGRCLIAGFYDRVAPPTPLEQTLLAQLPFDALAVSQAWGLPALTMPPGVPPYERLLFQPTLNINGLSSGYGGEGSKTIIPAQAVAKIDVRLVPEQDPDSIWELVATHVRRYAPAVQVRRLSAAPPSKTAVDLPVSQAIIRAVGRVHNRAPLVFPLTGGTSPRHVFTHLLRIPTVTVPYSNHDQNQHAPNENLSIECFLTGIQVSAEVFSEIARELSR